jgi:hypothetical protein
MGRSSMPAAIRAIQPALATAGLQATPGLACNILESLVFLAVAGLVGRAHGPREKFVDNR